MYTGIVPVTFPVLPVSKLLNDQCVWVPTVSPHVVSGSVPRPQYSGSGLSGEPTKSRREVDPTIQEIRRYFRTPREPGVSHDSSFCHE